MPPGILKMLFWESCFSFLSFPFLFFSSPSLLPFFYPVDLNQESWYPSFSTRWIGGFQRLSTTRNVLMHPRFYFKIQRYRRYSIDYVAGTLVLIWYHFEWRMCGLRSTELSRSIMVEREGWYKLKCRCSWASDIFGYFLPSQNRIFNSFTIGPAAQKLNTATGVGDLFHRFTLQYPLPGCRVEIFRRL